MVGEPMTHHCHAKGCTVEVPPKLLMCKPHWYLVPADLQRLIWMNYVAGQEVRKDPTPEYLRVMEQAIQVVAAVEARRAGALRALTLVQPWATFMMLSDGQLDGVDKDVENRPMAPPVDLIGKRFAVHAGLKFDERDEWGLKKYTRSLPPMEFPQGCLLGTLELVGFVRFTPGATPSEPWEGGRAEGLTFEQVKHVVMSRWRAPNAKACWLVRNPLMLPKPLPCKGALGLWTVPPELAERVRSLGAA